MAMDTQNGTGIFMPSLGTLGLGIYSTSIVHPTAQPISYPLYLASFSLGNALWRRHPFIKEVPCIQSGTFLLGHGVGNRPSGPAGLAGLVELGKCNEDI